MLNKKALILMTKFALYDKDLGKKDRKIQNYFASDYIYSKNRWTRAFVFIGCIIVLFFYWLHKIVVDKVDVFSLDFQQTLVNASIFIVVMLVFYSVLGSIREAREHSESKKRTDRYFTLLKRLESINTPKK